MLTDIEMPRMNGWKLIEKVNERCDCGKMAILAMSGSLPEIQNRLVQFLSKPFSMDELDKAILEALKVKQGQGSGEGNEKSTRFEKTFLTKVEHLPD